MSASFAASTLTTATLRGVSEQHQHWGSSPQAEVVVVG